MKDILITLNKFQTSNIKLQTMTSIITERLQEQYDSSNKSYKGKIISGDKERATKRYFKDAASHERRKQGKTRFDTHRREEQPDAEDLRLEDIHFANFLGLPRSEDGVPYNNVHINEPVNIIECDIYLKPESSKNVAEEAVAPQEEEGEYVDSFVPQIQREPNCVWNMNWIYEPEIQTLTGYSTFKRGLDEEAEEEQLKKRAKEQDRETAIFESMVTYMREQLELAQAMIDADELYVCDCEHK